MPVVDCHVHLYPPEVNVAPSAWAKVRGEHHWDLLCTRVRRSGGGVQGFPDVATLLRAMDHAGVERVVLQGWYWEHHDTCVFQNLFFERVLAAHPDRISACMTLNPRQDLGSALAEMRRCRDAGFCGIGELSPHSQRIAVNSPEWQGLLAEAAALRLPVLLHVTEPAGRGYPGRIPTPLGDFTEMAASHPGVTFILAHRGARLPMDPVFGEKVRGMENVCFDTAASPLLYDPRVFQEMISAVGAHRLLFGSDYPLVLYPREQVVPDIARFIASALQNGPTFSS